MNFKRTRRKKRKRRWSREKRILVSEVGFFEIGQKKKKEIGSRDLGCAKKTRNNGDFFIRDRSRGAKKVLYAIF